ncbi:MAG: hypothetical protein J5791_01575 [Fibrobacter sp.]|nr:hypothetical protein [Fibrobacter sp.]
METLIFLAIAVIIAIFENKVKKSREQKQLPPADLDDYDSDHAEDSEEEAQEPQVQPPRSLQDLIQQFENAQREAAQGNIEPPTPPVERQRDPSKPVTFREVAEAVIEMDVVDVEFLIEEFNLSEGDAISAFNELQKHRIIGRDMGDGECDVLVHDLDELDNLLNRERRAAPQQKVEELAEPQESAADTTAEQARQQELERQRKLNSLEGRAKSARESAAAFSATKTSSDTEDGTAPKPRRAPLVSTRSLADVRRGFIWAKVLDEPRFKRRWSAQYR